MKKWPSALLLAGAVALAAWYFLRNSSRPAANLPESTETAPAAGNPTLTGRAPARPAALNPSAPTTAQSPTPALSPLNAAAINVPPRPYVLGSPDSPPPMEPATVLGNMRIVIHNYGSRFGGNPVGTNPEITDALNGGNPKEVKFIDPEMGLRINGNGELVDYWGTPFFFHQLSAMEMEIRSAGPDKKMWTPDDLVTK